MSGLFGLVLSFLFLSLGVTHMGLRYLVCLALSYLLFLALVRLWASRHSLDEDPGLDLLDLPSPSAGGSDGIGGGGGQFSGGGASGSWDSDVNSAGSPVIPSSSDGSSISDAAGSLDLDEGWILALPIVLVVGAVLAAGYIISVAPILLAEVALDVAIAAGAYRRATRVAPQYWALGAFRRTWVVALILAILVGAVGSALAQAAPSAHTVGEALLAITGASA